MASSSPGLRVHCANHDAQSIDEFADNPTRLEQYSLVLLVGPTRNARVLERICQHAETLSIPLFYIHCQGFFSHFSVQLPVQFPIVDTHPDPASTQDLRLLNPWPELIEFLAQKTKHLDSLSDHDHGHIPYLLILLYFLNIWKASHDGKYPANYAEKKEFKVLVENGARTNNSEGGEENFDEAAAAVLKSLNQPSISSGLREVFEADDCQNLKPMSANFWVVANAIQKFHSIHNGILPLPGALPDMKAQSSDYIRLQNIYKAKARSDLAEVTRTIRSSEQELGRKFSIEQAEIEAFCKGAQFVKLIHGRPIRVAKCTAEIDWSDRAKALSQELQDPDSLLPIYFAFLALDRYQDDIDRIKKLRKPDDDKQTNDLVAGRVVSGAVPPLPTFAESAHFSTPAVDPEHDPKPWPRFDTPEAQIAFDNVVKELDRADGGELHNVAALTGGMVAQEAIKVITKQYVPVENTCVFDGIASKTAVFKI